MKNINRLSLSRYVVFDTVAALGKCEVVGVGSLLSVVCDLVRMACLRVYTELVLVSSL